MFTADHLGMGRESSATTGFLMTLGRSSPLHSAVHASSPSPTWRIKGKYRAHGKEWMRTQLKALWDLGARHLVFQDDCLTSDRQSAVELCKVLSDFGFAWFGTTRADRLDEELADMMKACGCYELSFGIESGSPRILQRMNKMLDLEQSLNARMFCKRAGIKFTALMMYGFPYETPETVHQTQAFLQKLQPD